VVAVHDVDLVRLHQPGEVQRQAWVEAGSPRERHDWHLKSFNLVCPTAGLVQAAHDEIDPGTQGADDFDDEPLGAPWRQAQHELHDAQL
jgi:hypothetical protein